MSTEKELFDKRTDAEKELTSKWMASAVGKGPALTPKEEARLKRANDEFKQKKFEENRDKNHAKMTASMKGLLSGLSPVPGVRVGAEGKPELYNPLKPGPVKFKTQEEADEYNFADKTGQAAGLVSGGAGMVKKVLGKSAEVVGKQAGRAYDKFNKVASASNTTKRAEDAAKHAASISGGVSKEVKAANEAAKPMSKMEEIMSNSGNVAGLGRTVKVSQAAFSPSEMKAAHAVTKGRQAAEEGAKAVDATKKAASTYNKAQKVENAVEKSLDVIGKGNMLKQALSGSGAMLMSRSNSPGGKDEKSAKVDQKAVEKFGGDVDVTVDKSYKPPQRSTFDREAASKTSEAQPKAARKNRLDESDLNYDKSFMEKVAGVINPQRIKKGIEEIKAMRMANKLQVALANEQLTPEEKASLQGQLEILKGSIDQSNNSQKHQQDRALEQYRSKLASDSAFGRSASSTLGKNLAAMSQADLDKLTAESGVPPMDVEILRKLTAAQGGSVDIDAIIAAARPGGSVSAKPTAKKGVPDNVEIDL